MISVIIDPNLQYPDATDCFSPDERYPEYQYEQISSRPNPVYRAVRQCFVQAALDREHLGTPAWNPLGAYVKPGNRVFLLCNFANERRSNESVEDFRSRCTHGSIIRVLTDYILIAAGKDGHVSIGNAPTQYCHWDAVLRDTEAREALQFYQSVGAPVAARDLRLFVTDATGLGTVKSVERRDENGAVHVCLDRDSLFDELDHKQPNRYRVMNYDPRRISSFHSYEHHEYVVSRTILEADVIFSAPKLKTHEKVGISCAIKGMVGTAGHKDSLPHHRYGSPKAGGDEYPTDPVGLASLSTAFNERVEQTTPDTTLGSFLRMSHKIFRKLVRRWTPVIEGAWWGNETAWRMAVDLARIATYANKDGEMQPSPCRTHIALTDGIIGGEKDGPAYSSAIHSGVLTFSDDLSAADHANAVVMGFDPEKIPMIRESAKLKKYPIARGDVSTWMVDANGQRVPLAELGQLKKVRFEPHEGWKDVL